MKQTRLEFHRMNKITDIAIYVGWLEGVGRTHRVWRTVELLGVDFITGEEIVLSSKTVYEADRNEAMKVGRAMRREVYERVKREQQLKEKALEETLKKFRAM